MATHADGPDLLATVSASLGPAEAAETLERLVTHLVGGQARIFVVDYAQTCLVELSATPPGDDEAFSLDGTVAGRAYTSGMEQDVEDESGWRSWLPLLEGTNRIGVLEVRTDAELTDGQRTKVRAIAVIVASVLLAANLRSDVLPILRRRQPMQLAAEMLWAMLPPLTFATDLVSVAGILEPCYDVGGDAFDYAINGRVAHVALFDAVGHGIASSRLSSLTIAAYRNARRNGLDLLDTARSLDVMLHSEAPRHHFVTALLAELDLDTGSYRRVSAGHPGELLARGGKIVKTLPVPSWTPLGLGHLGLREPEAYVESLEPGDRLLLFSDGVTEARSATRELFGEERLGDYFVKALADGLPAAETMRRLVQALLAYQDNNLSDDATALLLGWRV